MGAMGTKSSSPTACTKVPPQIWEIVKDIPNRSAWIREAIIEKLQRQGLVNQK